MLAGGGHTHALVLKRWAMKPHLKPKCLITLVNRDSSTIYSGMFPGLISGDYQLDEVSIDLRRLTDKAGVSLVVGEIHSLDIYENRLFLHNRASIGFSRLSLDVGSETLVDEDTSYLKDRSDVFPIRPFEKSLECIKELDVESQNESTKPFTVIGSGLAALEIVFALRKRWPARELRLQAFSRKLNWRFKKAINLAKIDIISPKSLVDGPAVICTGNEAPKWLKNSGLKVNNAGRIITLPTLEIPGRPDIFAVGDCGVLAKNSRPPSGVWAVRAAKPLAKNLERSLSGKSLLAWRPQSIALKLVGGISKSNMSIAWSLWGFVVIGPNRLIWKLKQSIDRGFVKGFEELSMVEYEEKIIACRGCASKVAAQPLKSALKSAELDNLINYPEDAALVASSLDKGLWLQSVDGFPALSNDPWLNARLTTLHACSDLWARGASVTSAQAVITLPTIHQKLQQELLIQCLSGIKSALMPQGAELIGGHTYESRTELSGNISMDIEISLSINGLVVPNIRPWSKGGLQIGDEILISRGIGTGVIFSAAMKGAVPAKHVDAALFQLSQSQHVFVEGLRKQSLETNDSFLIHACTDITGFGLLGHLGEMIQATNIKRLKASLPLVKINLFANSIPVLDGVKNLFKLGYESTLAPSNRCFLELLNLKNKTVPFIELIMEDISSEMQEVHLIKELLVDPQTCGPLVISCESKIANSLIDNYYWHRIGFVDTL
ncbi:NADH dehydrogenase, FAD-containing subunit [Prochlorococcus marinus subsp. marinus str. CCMP1375]|uniref:NADH dehydrogenase, FAD-containing subunit n=1 Tax=Prochlorococcus marinus (strain SARG / CCMP1375 / SS120) TaxID=167539 RepID=Q7VDN5_PROMA|nr:NADH dehydrogenase, FAD-containing subunit [Prochlorococcus marinus subsp. marinus str. CCMP1375]